MTATEAALEDAWLQQLLDRDREDLVGSEHGTAEVAERERTAQPLAATDGVCTRVHLDAVAAEINSRPSKTLGRDTPAERLSAVGGVTRVASPPTT
ncbi:hypothetical protein [Streptomyces lavenduligriseus]|uniref:DUF222 domain-containing protein n=1 Tax=Streptomyces lavenduligriseus TaxID=67315 RepID=A0ABT0P3I3_9ACTN|nr:hypothetical protein [Streptomyces lavenduligriseus]MCL3998310.1 hypothetical protein [Streptomyces lavenduligriseus]